MRLVGVSVRYSRRGPDVLGDVDVELVPGDTVVVSGRNGAGKSTLLRVLAGLLPVARGEVLDRPGVVGWVPDRFPVTQPFTVRAYLDGMARVQGLTPADFRPRLAELAERLALTPFLDTSLGAVSQGTGRKVGLVLALLPRPELVVMDEPWDGLDAHSQAELPGLVADVTGRGGICVVTDHRARAGELRPTRHWQVAGGRVSEQTVAAPPAPAPRRVIEVVVPAEESHDVAASLRAAGYEVRAVRDDRC